MSAENTHLCIKCGKPAVEGKQELTIKTPEAVTTFEFFCCTEHGPLLQNAIMQAFQKWKEKKGSKEK